MVLRGREKYLPDRARDNVVAFLQTIQFPHKIEEDIKRAPNGFSALLAPQS
jgi:hypothetical protein